MTNLLCPTNAFAFIVSTSKRDISIIIRILFFLFFSPIYTSKNGSFSCPFFLKSYALGEEISGA
jgi:hypothetical protein